MTRFGMTQSGGKTRRISLRALLWLAITILVSLFVVSVVFSVYGRNGVRDAVDELAQDVMPAQRSVAMLRTAFVDQETGQRGFVLTGDPGSSSPTTEAEERRRSCCPLSMPTSPTTSRPGRRWKR
jgi:CHASE3 domain sensor protein